MRRRSQALLSIHWPHTTWLQETKHRLTMQVDASSGTARVYVHLQQTHRCKKKGCFCILEDMPTGNDMVNVTIHMSDLHSQIASHGLKLQSKYKRSLISSSHMTLHAVTPNRTDRFYKKMQVDRIPGSAPLTERLRRMGVGVREAPRRDIKYHQGQ